jgi:hypothetical protein
MISCCEIALALAVANIISLAVFAGYTVKLRTRQFELEKRNGNELREILELKEKITQLEKQIRSENNANNSS